MTFTIESDEQRFTAWKAKAAAQGLTVDAWLKKLADENAGIGTPADEVCERSLITEQADTGSGAVQPASHAADKAKAREFVEWAKDHPYTPPLSDEAISRASLNPDRC